MLIAAKNIGPTDATTYTIDYSEWLAAGEQLASVQVSVSPTSTPAFEASAAVGPTVAFVQLSVDANGTEEDIEYTVSVEVTTDATPARVQTDCIRFNVVSPCGD